jgi:hypothetical protein
MVLDHEIEVIGDESFSTEQEAMETTIDRIMADGPVNSGWVQ